MWSWEYFVGTPCCMALLTKIINSLFLNIWEICQFYHLVSVIQLEFPLQMKYHGMYVKLQILILMIHKCYCYFSPSCPKVSNSNHDEHVWQLVTLENTEIHQNSKLVLKGLVKWSIKYQVIFKKIITRKTFTNMLGKDKGGQNLGQKTTRGN